LSEIEEVPMVPRSGRRKRGVREILCMVDAVLEKHLTFVLMVIVTAASLAIVVIIAMSYQPLPFLVEGLK
jgi:hypothetical protein